MKKKNRNVLIISIIGFVIIFGLLINNFIISTRIYYKINYEGSIQNFESLIEKSELFEYQKYCKYRDDWLGEVHNVSNSDDYYHIDRDFIESLKLKIENDQKKFHFNPFLGHILLYSLEATNESLIYLTYNNNSIIKADFADHTEIFAARSSYYENHSLYWVENWYLNFTHIPFAFNTSSTVILNDIILVKMNLHYDYVYGNVGAEGLIIEQFLCFNNDLQIMFIYFPLRGMVLA